MANVSLVGRVDMIPRPLTALRSFFWALLHPGQLTAEETAAFVAPEPPPLASHAQRRSPEWWYVRVVANVIEHVKWGGPKSLVVDLIAAIQEHARQDAPGATLSRAELVELVSRAMKAGLLDSIDTIDEAFMGDVSDWSEMAEKLLAASLARRASNSPHSATERTP